MVTHSESGIRVFFSNRWYLAQLFLVIAGAFGWNILGLEILLKRHKYLRAPDWWSIMLIFGVIVFVAVLGWIWAIFSYRNPHPSPESPRQQAIRVALRSSGVVFLLGWVICIWLMLRLMHNEPWCIAGAIGSMLEDWLPNGIIISVLVGGISLLASRWFLAFKPEQQFEVEN